MSFNPSQRTHDFLRDLGIRCGTVERNLSRAHKADLFGFLDQVAMNPTGIHPFPASILGIQSTGGDSNGNGNARIAKIRSKQLWPAVQDWLDCDGDVFVFSWVRLHTNGTNNRYELRYYQVLDQESEVKWEVWQ